MHEVGGVTAALVELAALGDKLLLAVGFAVLNPDVVEILASLQAAAVAADQPDFAVDVGGRVASAGGRPVDDGVLVVVGDFVERLLLLDGHFPVELRGGVGVVGEVQLVRSHLALVAVLEAAVHLDVVLIGVFVGDQGVRVLESGHEAAGHFHVFPGLLVLGELEHPHLFGGLSHLRLGVLEVASYHDPLCEISS